MPSGLNLNTRNKLQAALIVSGGLITVAAVSNFKMPDKILSDLVIPIIVYLGSLFLIFLVNGSLKYGIDLTKRKLEEQKINTAHDATDRQVLDIDTAHPDTISLIKSKSPQSVTLTPQLAKIVFNDFKLISKMVFGTSFALSSILFVENQQDLSELPVTLYIEFILFFILFSAGNFSQRALRLILLNAKVLGQPFLKRMYSDISTGLGNTKSHPTIVSAGNFSQKCLRLILLHTRVYSITLLKRMYSTISTGLAKTKSHPTTVSEVLAENNGLKIFSKLLAKELYKDLAFIYDEAVLIAILAGIWTNDILISIDIGALSFSMLFSFFALWDAHSLYMNTAEQRYMYKAEQSNAVNEFLRKKGPVNLLNKIVDRLPSVGELIESRMFIENPLSNPKGTIDRIYKTKMELQPILRFAALKAKKNELTILGLKKPNLQLLHGGNISIHGFYALETKCAYINTTQEHPEDTLMHELTHFVLDSLNSEIENRSDLELIIENLKKDCSNSPKVDNLFGGIFEQYSKNKIPGEFLPFASEYIQAYKDFKDLCPALYTFYTQVFNKAVIDYLQKNDPGFSQYSHDFEAPIS